MRNPIYYRIKRGCVIITWALLMIFHNTAFSLSIFEEFDVLKVARAVEVRDEIAYVLDATSFLMIDASGAATPSLI